MQDISSPTAEEYKLNYFEYYTAAQGRDRRGDYTKDEIRSKAGFQ